MSNVRERARWFSGSGPYLVIIGLGLMVYARTLGFGFNYLDDNTLILDRQNWLRNPAYFFQAFKEDAFRSNSSQQFYYRPMLTNSFLLDTQLGGVHPWVYRLTNLLLHLASCCLAFKFFRSLGLAVVYAIFFSLILTVHPVFVQAVTWIPARNETLLLLFVVPSFLAFLEFMRTAKPVYFLAHLLAWSLALLTRENAALLPLVCLSYLYFVRREIPKTKTLTLLASWLILGGLWMWIRGMVLRGAGPVSFGGHLETVAQNSLAGVAMIGRIFLPLGLSVYPVLDNAKIIFGAVSLAILAGLFRFCGCRDKRLAWFGLSWFILFLLPMLVKPHDSFAPVDILEIRIYTASLGLGILLSTLNLKSVAWARMGGGLLRGLSSLILLVSIVVSIRYSDQYRDRIRFWENAAATSPSSAFVHNNLGAMYFLEEKLDLARDQWLKAAQMNPSEKLVHGNLGLVYLRHGDFAAAENELKTELALNPVYDNAYYNLGLVYYGSGRILEALRMWERTLEINPDYQDAYIHLISHEYNYGDLSKARAYREKARLRGLALSPELDAALQKAV
jgi:Flp pilus assembly protein TadD